MDLPKRKRIRLKGYDYSQNGAYFVTICIADRRGLLWDNVGATGTGEHHRGIRASTVGANCVRPLSTPLRCSPECPHETPPLSVIGQTVDNEIHRIDDVYSNVVVDKYCIMPDHIHMIIFIMSDEDGRTQFAPTLSRIIKQFKGSITKQIGFPMWQKSFNDRIIRNERGYREVWQYIDENPLSITDRRGSLVDNVGETGTGVPTCADCGTM